MAWLEDEANGAGGVARQPVVMDFTKPRGMADFMQPPAGGWDGAGKNVGSGGDYWESRGLEAPVGLWTVKGEDLTLRPGVPALATNPAARPLSKAAIRQAANWGVSNAGEFVATARRAVAPDGGEPAANIADASAPAPVVAVEDKPEGAQEQEVVPPAPGALTGESFAQAPAPQQGAPEPPEQTNDGTPPPTGQSGDAVEKAKEPKPYTISADGRSVSYGAKPYDGMMAAWKDGVIAQPGIEQWHAARVAQQVEEAKAGNKLYRVDDQGRLSFDPRHAVAGLDQAMGDGVADGGSAWALREELYNHPGHGMDAQRAAMFAAMSGPELRAELEAGEIARKDMPAIIRMQQEAAQGRADEGKPPEPWYTPEGLSAFFGGLAKGSGKTAAGMMTAEALEPVNAIASAWTGPLAPATFGFLNMVEFLGGSFLAGKAIDAVSDAAGEVPGVDPLRQAMAEHPGEAQWGEALPGYLMAASSVKNLVGRAIREGLAPVVKQMAGGGIGGGVMETIRPYVERSLEAGVEQMGLKPEQVQPATLRSVATSAGWAALLSGAGGSETAKKAVERAPVELLRLAEQSPELMALHPEIGEVIAQKESAMRIAPQATAMGEGRNQSLKEARIVAAKKIMAGTHLQLQAYDAIANSSDPRITDAQRAYAAAQAETMRGRAVGLLRMKGMESDAATEASPAIQESDGNKAMEPPRTSSMKAGHWAGKTVDNPLEITNKQNENEQDHEYAIQRAAPNLSPWPGKQPGAGTTPTVERQLFAYATGDQTGNDTRGRARGEGRSRGFRSEVETSSKSYSADVGMAKIDSDGGNQEGSKSQGTNQNAIPSFLEGKSKQRVEKVIKEARAANARLVKALGMVFEETTLPSWSSGLEFNLTQYDDGTTDLHILIDSNRVMEEWELVAREKGVEAADQSVHLGVDEEITHYIEVLVSLPKFRETFQKVWTDVPAAAKLLFDKVYPSAITAWHSGAEWMRMLSQLKRGIGLTEDIMKKEAVSELLPYLRTTQTDHINTLLFRMEAIRIGLTPEKRTYEN